MVFRESGETTHPRWIGAMATRQEIRFRRIRTESVQTARKSRATMVRRMTSSSEGHDASDVTIEDSGRNFPPTDPGTPPHYPQWCGNGVDNADLRGLTFGKGIEVKI